VVNLRVVAKVHGPPIPRFAVPRQPSAPQPHRFRWNGRWLRAQRWQRMALPRSRRLSGPLLITEFSATTVLPPGWTVTAFATGDLLLEWRPK